MKLSNVRPSVCLSHSVAAHRCGGFAAVGPARAGDTDRLLHGQRPAVSSSPAAARRAAANAGSATLSADVGSCTETCVVMHNRQRKLFHN